MSRCQRTIVSDVTSSRSSWRRVFGIMPSRAVSRAPVRPIEPRAARLPPLQDGELVAQDQDPEVILRYRGGAAWFGLT